MGRTISVLLVDDSEVVRLGLRSLLNMYPQMRIVGEAAKAAEAIRCAADAKPDVVLLDVRMPEVNGITACREILKVSPQTAVLMLTSYDDDEAIYAAVLAGASGYILKEISSQDLVNAIEQVASGKSLLDPASTGRLLQRLRKSAAANKLTRLTEQEHQVLHLIAQGKTNKEIAQCLILSEKTVRNYVTQILAKLEVSNRAEAAVFAVRSEKV